MIETPQPQGVDGLHLLRPIVLIGLMGAGKTSVGKRLAALLGVPFTDSDSRIVEAAGMSVPEIFASLGEPAFRDGERRVIARLLAERPGVIATGGGAFVEARTRAEIAKRGVSVWLRADLETLWERVRDRPGRPLLQTADPKGTLADLHRRRMPIYAHADVAVDSRRGISHDTMARSIVAAVRGWDESRPGEAPTFGDRP